MTQITEASSATPEVRPGAEERFVGTDVHVLADGAYETRSGSELFPALELDLFAVPAAPGKSLTAAVRDFRTALANL